ncbi:MAG: CDP-archaeol synthase [Gemmataceae bacterium]|nr:phosphatidate cytidylyltransferase [Gemmata sp.]MDW8198120.1 CDP-archaeol synthase [Gemmataceae bacterium]
MIRTRLLVGTLLALGAAGVLWGDTRLAQSGWAGFPCLWGVVLVAGFLAARELVRLFPPVFRPPEGLVIAGVLLLLSANWYPAIAGRFGTEPTSLQDRTPWAVLVLVFVGVFLVAFLREMHHYHGEPGAAIPRLALVLLALTYLGWLPCFFIQIRWLAEPDVSTIMLALVVFVPKGNDIGAFFTGTFFGRHKMTPILSPKKTWEGFAGGMATGIGVAVALSFLAPVFHNGMVEAVAFGIVVGMAGVLGDLAESLIKRDCQTKDASHAIPGFGGILDVIDSVLLAAPVGYLWFRAG